MAKQTHEAGKATTLSSTESVKQEDEIFRQIGEFIVYFSALEFSIRCTLAEFLALDNQQFDAVTSSYDFTKLCNVTQVIVTQKLPQQAAAVKAMFSACKNLNDNRVRVAHGTWMGGPKGGWAARHASRGKLSPDYYFDNPSALQKLTDEAAKLEQEFFTIMKKARLASP